MEYNTRFRVIMLVNFVTLVEKLLETPGQMCNTSIFPSKIVHFRAQITSYTPSYISE